MQEVVKRMQERQEQAEPKPKEDVYYTLCLVRANNIAHMNGIIFPVIFPNRFYSVAEGDLVLFQFEVHTILGEVLYVDDYVREDDKAWTAIVLASGKIPVRAIKHYRMMKFEWEEES